MKHPGIIVVAANAAGAFTNGTAVDVVVAFNTVVVTVVYVDVIAVFSAAVSAVVAVPATPVVAVYVGHSVSAEPV